MNKYQALILQAVIFIAFAAMTLPYPSIAPIFLSAKKTIHSTGFLAFIPYKLQASLVLGCYPLGLFLGGILFGYLSDKYNKKLLLLLSLIAASFTNLISANLVSNGLPEFLLLTRFLSGLFEGNIVIARAALAVISTTESAKKKHFSRANAALTLGWTIGPLVGAFISHNQYTANNYGMPFYIASILILSVFLLVLFKFETPTNLSSKFNKNKPIEVLNSKLLNKKIIPLFLFSFLITLGIDSFYQFLPIFLAASQTHSSTFIIGIAVSTVAICGTTTNLLLIPKLNHHISTTKSIIIFPILLSLCFVLLTVINIFIVLPFIGALIAIIMTNMTVYLSMKCSDANQGKLMGILLGQRTLGTALISFFMAPLLNYGYTVPFFIGAFLLILSSYISSRVIN